MRLNVHSPTPSSKTPKFITVMFIVIGVLFYSVFCLMAFCCFAYADSPGYGVACLVGPIILAAFVIHSLKDFDREYIEIREDEIYVANFWFGIKIEKHVPLSDITSAQVCVASSFKVRGIRPNIAGLRYIVFSNGKKYLFKIIYLPETEKIFEKYIH